ncbi:MAG: flagellar hook-basal body complex protein, partial [Chitinispirillales bacterium]|nr:flagellar hook-basal body complex protein [Chitinispirillales bacterium]
MLRSLYTGIAGLRNHQLKMDVTSHNIANVNTIGYKSQRITFKEGFSQMLKGATRPAGNASGTNPMQVGLGMAVGSIDNIMEQGAMQSTGQLTDLGIEGRAFFAFSNGNGGTFYGRNGALQLSAEGYLVSNTNGYHLLGLTADSDGEIPATAVPGSIKVPFGEKSPARATEEIQFQCNLDADSVGSGTYLYTAPFLKSGEAADLLVALNDGIGNSLGIKDNDVLRITYKDATGAEVISPNLNVRNDGLANSIYSLQDLADAIQNALPAGATVGIGAVGTPQAGQIIITNPGGAISNLVVNNITRPNSNSYVANTFLWSGAVNAGDTSVGSTLAAATSLNTLDEIFDARGKPLGLTAGDPIEINGMIGDIGLSAAAPLLYTPTLTMADLMAYIQLRLRLPDEVPNSSGLMSNSVEINQPGANGDSRAPVGSIIIRGQQGKAFAIEGLNINAKSSTNNTSVSIFNANSSVTEFQSAKNTGFCATSIEVFDESGAPHTVTMNFTHSGTPGKWLWEITMKGQEIITGGNRGVVTFSEDGSPAAWIFDDGSTSFKFNPNNGSAELSISLDVGKNKSWAGITQFRSATTTTAKAQDGYP